MSDSTHVLKNNPKVLFIFLLTLFFVTTSFGIPIYLSFYLFVLCIGFTVLADLLFTFFRRRTFFIPYSAIITGLIIALIIDLSASWYQILAICLAAMGMKNFVRISGRHILNPAASGLIVGWVIFDLYPSWWAATLYTPGAFTIPNVLLMLSLLALGFVSCHRYKKYHTVISFLLFFSILSVLFSSSFSAKSLISVFISPGILFYTIVMVAEPMTSPVNKQRQTLHGFFVALMSALFVLAIQKNILPSNMPDSSLLALLLGNLLFFKYR